MPTGKKDATAPTASETATAPAAPARRARSLDPDCYDPKPLLAVLAAVRKGDFSARYVTSEAGVAGRVADALNGVLERNEQLAAELSRIAEVVGTKGRLSERAAMPGAGGAWRSSINCVNELVANLGQPVDDVERVIGSVARGDLSQQMPVTDGEGAPLRGDFLRTARTVNTMVEQLSAFASEVTRVSREVGTEGKLGGQAEVPGVNGTWRDLTESVNSMADNLTTQVRNIADVTTAVANGDLSKKITVEARGEIMALKNTINTMVDQLSSFASEVTRVAREVGSEGKLGGQARVEGVSGTWKDLTDNVNSMADNLTTQVRNIAEVTTAVANGDLSKQITVEAQGEILELKATINQMVDQLSAFAAEVTRVAREVGTSGQLGGQAQVPGVSGTWRDLTESVNSMADNLTSQVRNIAEVTTAVANGDLSKQITVEAQGEIAELKATINQMVDQLSAFASEVTRVAREVGTEGELGGQARVPGVSGTWKDLTDNVNSMASNLTAQVRNIADVTTAVAMGDLSKKITVDVKGEIAELKTTINTMVDQLSAFASEVTRVAREVGTEGKLGGQAVVEGVSGTWKGLTDNVNSMADNLTTQVRGIAEVVTAVAQGNLDQKLQVEAQGEIAALRDTINNMIVTLDTFAEQVTSVAREVGVEGKLGGQAEVPGASGTWRDLTDNVNRLAANLTTQVRAITEVTTAVAAGDLSKKITVEAAGEVADLKDNVNEMIRNLKDTTRKNEEQDWLKTNLAKFTQLLQGQKELVTVSRLILSELAPLVNVQHGAFYSAERGPEDTETAYRLLASYAYKDRRGLSNRFRAGEGLVGQCALEKERILITDVPDDYVRVSSGLGSAPPRNIVVLPVLFEGEVKAVIELASFQRFNQNQLTFFDQLTESIGIVLNSIEANMRTESLLKQSQGLTQELQDQQAELQETNRRLEEQARTLGESEELLKRQQEALQRTNVELEEKARELAEQNAEVERKNAEIEQARSAVEEKAEQLALTSRYKSDFLANMSHELRTPLNSMLILSRMLAQNAGGALSPKQIEYAETIFSSGSDLLALINEILDLSKIESGVMAVEVEPVPFDELSEDLQRVFREVANQKQLEFEVKLDPSLPTSIETDAKRLQQVLKNLLSNAFKFTHEGSVTLSIAPADAGTHFRSENLGASDNVLAFAIEDTGIGISPDKHRVIFEAFQQGDGSVTRTYGGTGLGLSISREIARLLGGEIQLRSTPGEGSTFTLYLPAIYQAPLRDAMIIPTAVIDSGDGSASLADGHAVSGAPLEASAADGSTSLTSGGSASLDTENPDSSNGAPDDEASADGPSKPQSGGGSASITAGGSTSITAGNSPSRLGSSRVTTAGGDGVSSAAADAHTTSVAGPGDDRSGQHLPVRDDRTGIKAGDRVLLIVEDDPTFAGILLEMAREQGFKGIVAANAESALNAIRRYKPHAITLDLRLPGMHGLALLDRLKNTAETRHIPVQIVSVSDTLPRRRRKGAFAQSQKPITREAITSLMERSRDMSDERPRRLLVVEDDEVQRRLVEELVDGDDVEIVGAARGEDALKLLGEGKFDCIMVDLGLPDMDGMELVRRIRSDAGLPDVPIVVHSGRDLTPVESDFLYQNADAIVAKDAEAFDRLLDATALYLHRQESTLPQEQQARLAEFHRPEAALAGRRVLIVDDDRRNIFALASLLEQHRLEVVYAESAREAFQILEQQQGKIDAVLMDVMMPEMDGNEATRRIRANPRFRTLPVIAVTAKAMKGDREKSLAAGASDHVTKPVNPDHLLSVLRVWIGK